MAKKHASRKRTMLDEAAEHTARQDNVLAELRQNQDFKPRTEEQKRQELENGRRLEEYRRNFPPPTEEERQKAVRELLQNEVPQVLEKFQPEIEKDLAQNLCSPFLVLAIEIMEIYPTVDPPRWLTKAVYKYANLSIRGELKRRRGAAGNPLTSKGKRFERIQCALIHDSIKQSYGPNKHKKMLISFMGYWYTSRGRERLSEKIINAWVRESGPTMKAFDELRIGLPSNQLDTPAHYVFMVPSMEIMNWYLNIYTKDHRPE